MTLAVLAGSKISVIEANNVSSVEFPSIEAALSALVKHQWVLVTALDRTSVLFQNANGDTLQHIEQLKMAAKLVETMAARRAISRLSIEGKLST